jgi:hypothetical protein
MLSPQRLRRALGALLILIDLCGTPRDACADYTQGSACSTKAAAGIGNNAVTDGNNLVCVSGTWQYPAYVHQSAAAAAGSSCSTYPAGSLRYNTTSSNIEYCNGSVWTAPSSGGGGGVTPNVQVFTSSGTYLWSSSYTFIEVFICGGGGQGANGIVGSTGQIGTGAEHDWGGSGGGGGACQHTIFNGSDIGGNVTVTIGVGGGTGGAGGVGSQGLSSTFGSFLTAYGGGGGTNSAPVGCAIGTLLPGSGGDLVAAGPNGNTGFVSCLMTANGFAGVNSGQPTSPYAGASGAGSTGGAANAWFAGPGGGLGGNGGGSTGAHTPHAGSSGGKSVGCLTATGGGTEPGGAGGSTAPLYNYLPGCGGGGGGGSTGTAGNGGNGTNAGGGGGGGGAQTGGTGGTGGIGGNGFAVVRSW